MILDYTYQKINTFKEGFALVMLNVNFGLINKSGQEIIAPVYEYPQTQLQCGIISFQNGYGSVVVFDATGKYLKEGASGGLLPCQRLVGYVNLTS